MANRLGELASSSTNSTDPRSSVNSDCDGDGARPDIENQIRWDTHRGEEADDLYDNQQSGDPPEVQVLLEAFNVEIDAIVSAIEQIEENVNEVEDKYKRSQKWGVTQAERRELAAQLSEVLGQTTQISHAVRHRLRRIADENEAFAREFAENGATLKIRVTAHQGVTQSFMAAMQRLEDVQERQHDAARVGVERELRRLNPDAKEEDIQNAMRQCDDKDGPSTIDDSPLLCQLPEEEQSRLREQLELLGNRNKNIRQLEQDVVNLHQMFTDMKLLVDQQGELLNTIEYNVQETKVRAEAGMVELIQARDYQQRAHRKKCCIAFLLAVIIGVALTIMFVVYGPGWFGAIADAGAAVGDGAADAAGVEEGGEAGDTVDSADTSGLVEDSARTDNAIQRLGFLRLV